MSHHASTVDRGQDQRDSRSRRTRRRRWIPRFSLRTMLILMTVICVVLGGIVHRVRRQSHAVGWIMAHGGTVAYQFRYGDYAMRQVTWDYGDHRDFSLLSRLVGPNVYLDVVGIQLHSGQVEDIFPLAGLSRVEYLDLRGTRIHDLTPLKNHDRLTTLRLSGTSVHDLSPMSGLHKLRVLQLGGTQVRDLQPLAELHELRNLDVSSTLVEDIQPLARHDRLRWLSLAGPIRDLNPLLELTALEELHLGDPLVKDLRLLGRLPNLKHVALHDGSIHAETSFAELKQLESLTLVRMSVEDLAAVINLDRIGFLILRNTPIRQSHFSAFQLALPDCWVLPRSFQPAADP